MRVCVFLYLLVLLCVYDIDRKSRKSVSSLEQCHLATAQALLIPFKCFFIDSECREREGRESKFRNYFFGLFSFSHLTMIDHDFVFRNIFRGVPISPFFLHIYTE